MHSLASELPSGPSDIQASTAAQPSVEQIRSDLPAKSVSLIGITKHYGGNVVLKPLSLEIRPGELLALLGPSGCGKTTTLRVLAGFVSPDSGTVRLDGEDVTDVPPNLRGLGMVFQSYSLFPHMTVLENVAFGLRMRGVPASRRTAPVREMLELVRLGDYADRYPSQLSGGQQQRVALARALVTRPSVLLLDEPLGALDKNLRERMQFEIRALQRSLGITTVLVTHDQEEAMTMSDRIAVMSGGEIIQIGEPASIYARPKNRFVSEFLGTSNLLEGTCMGRDPQGRVLVRLDLNGRINAGSLPPGVDDCPEGARVALAVRPEHLVVQASPSFGVECVLESRIFRGSYCVYELQAGAGTKLIAFTQVPDESIGIGDQVQVSWQVEQAVVLVD
ncbi:ABC transporter ATP-binding protein [Verticiella sediminum]|uniref:Spermidine/putrescine import ATP-binding protein PotA n=1 Tax=Verticiella sediminum TaxID=1247510 RepID=A0A556ACE7_9BURK|nr:ABC transporter ATP-binding protein [Verticiella sediminum]TSH90559.1 ABC transporter ATP-binding protein [Verticiella sediminum]